MVEIILLSSFKQVYHDIAAFTLKIIYRYEDETNTIFLIDIWDMRMNPKNITDKFKQ